MPASPAWRHARCAAAARQSGNAPPWARRSARPAAGPSGSWKSTALRLRVAEGRPRPPPCRAATAAGTGRHPRRSADPRPRRWRVCGADGVPAGGRCVQDRRLDPAPLDADLQLAAAALAATAETAMRGVLYEHQPETPGRGAARTGDVGAARRSRRGGREAAGCVDGGGHAPRRGSGEGIPPSGATAARCVPRVPGAGAEATPGRRADGPGARARRRPAAGAAGRRRRGRATGRGSSFRRAIRLASRRPSECRGHADAARRCSSRSVGVASKLRCVGEFRTVRSTDVPHPCATLGGSRARRRLLRGSSCRSGRGRASALSHG